MPKYIDAEKLEEATRNKIAVDHGWCRAVIDEDFIDLIYDADAEDVQEVKHGKWIDMSDADGYYYCCSVCGENLERIQTSPCTVENPYPDLSSCSKTKFCPNCGARMDGGCESK